MSESINILDKDYLQWVEELCKRYRKSQIRAAVKVNTEMLRFYWELGQDIETKEASNKYGSGFYAALSRDLRHKLPDADGLSETSVRYAKRFYCLYSPLEKSLPQAVEKSENTNLPKLWKICTLSYSLYLGDIIVISLTSVRRMLIKHCSMFAKQWKTVGVVLCC